MANEIELTATVIAERMRFANADGDVVILSATPDGAAPEDDDLALKGPAEGEEPRPGVTYRFWGRWTAYKNKRTGRDERQFAFSSFIRSGSPKGREAIVAYLSCCDGIGKAIATRLYVALGEETIKVCRERPEHVRMAVSGMSRTYGPTCLPLADHLSQWLSWNCDQEETMAELAGLLKGRGFPRETPKRCVELWKNRAPEMIRRNPYLLMKLDGIGFRRADAMYLELGHSPHRLKRQALCVQHAVDTARSGDTWSYVEVANQAVRAMIGGTKAMPGKAIRLAIRAGLLSAKFTEGVQGAPSLLGDTAWLASSSQARSEAQIVRELERLDAADAQWPVDQPVKMDEIADPKISGHQLDGLIDATQRPVGILAGCPGTGKTFTAAALVRAVIDHAGAEAIALAAPTGKAAVRLSESMNKAGVKVAARTIHSLLMADGKGFGAGPGKFQEMLEPTYYVIDEASMIDADLMAALLSAIPMGACVLFLGDTNQLLPVGHGAPLRDFIAAGLPCGELTEIRRNSGGIVEACAAIRAGDAFVLGDNLSLVESGQSVEDVVAHCSEVFGFDPVRDVQVVTAVNAKSDLSRRELNRQLQASLNPSQQAIGPFLLGDKVVCTANCWLTPTRDSGPGAVTNGEGNVRVANGEIGFIEAIDGRRTVVALTSPSRWVRVPVGPQRGAGAIDDESGDTGCNFDLAYAISVHRSQGSEFPCVVVALDPSGGANQVMDRAWVYTAISRASQRCVLWGDLAIAHRACRKNRIVQRKTFLREAIEASRVGCLSLAAVQ